MISVEQAKKLIQEHTTALNPVQIQLSEAAGHTLAQDICASCDIPAFRQSSMDGYALKFEENLAELCLAGEMAAGSDKENTINQGEAYRIFTGAALPNGADTVIMQEKVTIEGDRVFLNDPNLKAGINAREKGSEISTGEIAMTRGSQLTPAALGFLAGIGTTEVSVYPQPKIAIILTGNELQKPGLPLNFGQVYESNSYALKAALRQAGISSIEVLEAKDDLETLTEVLNATLKTNDMILLTGGVSVGDYDFVIQAAGNCGVKQIFHKVKQKPGKPLYFGTKQNQLIFGLPGNPSSVLSCFYNYVLPAIALLSNTTSKIQQIEAQLTAAYQKPGGLTHFLKGRYDAGKATALGAQESYRLSSFAQANCLICLEEEKTDFKIGDKITVFLLPN
ncbi:molybdopterin molybdotransferase MoeA [Pedobacter psychroterrae]|uniref:Molybdopterin molybdenumtransferase n=1 Tax=Pedobacter psychroterrae TaxID=2530453 RepID=A0A4R0NNL7_9SPHI|nr:gephyrin-like molybdotransferase Glp [Pedobacter psychroterrae]TCD02522.1 molybdopterin molybdenumtransferase MoeA [Pedobacter psychroterrae]